MSMTSIPIFSLATPASRSTSATERAMRAAISGSAPSDHFHVIAGRTACRSHGASISAFTMSLPTVSKSTGSPPRGSTA